jgi:hypothetical protein
MEHGKTFIRPRIPDGILQARKYPKEETLPILQYIHTGVLDNYKYCKYSTIGQPYRKR